MGSRINTITLSILLIGVVLLSASCSPKHLEKLRDGVLINLPNAGDNGAKKIRLQVITPEIIRVSATPGKEFSTAESLVVIKKGDPSVEWSLEEAGQMAILKTAALTVTVSLETGEVVFMDSLGQVILHEKEGGGKTFTPVTVEDKHFYSVRQVFQSPEDEAFYGLGQQQNGLMNYKGKDVELVQHNLVVVVPFLYSSRNYGLLWDNYSISRFGDPRPFEPLTNLQLFSKDGQAGGLTATYFDGDGKVIVSRQEQEIGYEYLHSFDGMPADFKMENGKAVWEGSISSQVSGAHKFLTYASGYFKVWVGGKLMIDRWRQSWNPWDVRFSFDMKAGEKYPFRIEWIPNGGKSYLAVKHLDPLSTEEQNNLSLFSEVANQIDYYFIKGANADQVISGYREVTGDAPIMPDWAMGFWQSRQRYQTQEQLLGALKDYRDRKIPIDNIVLDWFYWKEDQWGSHDFDSSRFPDPAGMVQSVHDMDGHIMISVWPKFYTGTKHFDEMNARGFLYQKNLQNKTKDWVGPGYQSTFYDAFNPEARDLYWKQLKPYLYDLGFDAWWMDATEPDMNSNESIEERKLMMSPTALGPGSQYFNAYSLVHSQGMYENSRAENPDKRVFILTRSAFAGQQRYAAATWSGDIAARWNDMKDQISAGLNFSISGIPYWTMDIGGFSVERRYENAKGEDLAEWREMLTRWYQFGAFCPLFRSHGEFPFREIYNIAPENSTEYNSMLFYDELRYDLMPYIYSLAGQTFHRDYTIMRPLIMDFPNDLSVQNIATQYMFGPNLLVCPVYEYKARSRPVYLPAGTGWYDLYSGRYFEGGQTIDASAPLDRMPVFVKEGSVLPFGPDIQSTNEGFYDSLTVFVYTGRNGSFELYEDEGENYDYEQGKYCTIELAYDENNQTLTVGERQGAFPEMVKNKPVGVVWITRENPQGVLNHQVDSLKEYNGNKLIFNRMGKFKL